MNNYFRTLSVFFIFFTINNINGQIWPTTGEYNVGLSFGSFQDRKVYSNPEQAFHDGIDIAGNHGIINVKAIGAGTIVFINSSVIGDSKDIFFKLDAAPRDIVVYGHCTPISSINLFIGASFSLGETIATIADASIANTSYDHCHFSYINSPNYLDFPNLTVNPLTQNSIASLVSDPGNNDPVLGELIIRPAQIIGSSQIPNNNSLNCFTKPYIFNKVRLVKEIRDDLGYSGDCFLYPDIFNNPWCLAGATTNTFRIPGGGSIGAPFAIGFEMLVLLKSVAGDQVYLSPPSASNCTGDSGQTKVSRLVLATKPFTKIFLVVESVVRQVILLKTRIFTVYSPGVVKLKTMSFVREATVPLNSHS